MILKVLPEYRADVNLQLKIHSAFFSCNAATQCYVKGDFDQMNQLAFSTMAMISLLF